MTHIEAAVKKQAKLLEEKMPQLLKSAKGKFVAFFNGVCLVCDTHEECFEKAEAEFGPKQGFVIDQVTSQVPIVSTLVKLQ